MLQCWECLLLYVFLPYTVWHFSLLIVSFGLYAVKFCHDSNHSCLNWRVFVRASLRVRREEKPTRCHWMVSCTYNMLNMFGALLCPSSGAWDYMCVITAYGVRCLGCWLLEVRCRAAGYAPGMRDFAEQNPSSRLWLCDCIKLIDMYDDTVV